MFLAGRVARGLGSGSPLLYAKAIGFITEEYFYSLDPALRIIADHHIMNRIIEAENKYSKEQLEKDKREKDLPGVARFVTASERSEQLRQMRANKALS